VTFSFVGFQEFVFGQDVLVQFKIGPAKISKERLDVLFV